MAHPPSSLSPSSPPFPDVLLVVGTYHSVTAGLLYRKGRLGMLFSIKHHTGAVDRVALCDRFMATAGPDERLFLFTHKPGPRLADLGHVSPPSEPRCLQFTPSAQHLLCGCADGRLFAYRTRDWAAAVALPLHERAVRAAAAHPVSGGALVVSAGADRRVAVVDLERGKLMTRWRYNPAPPQVKEREEKEEEEEGEKGKSAMGRKRQREAREAQREEPHAVCFSPSGKYFIVCSLYAFALYETATMETAAAFRMPQPLQPCDELHCVTFVNDERILFGNESGAVMECRGPWKADSVCTINPVELRGPQEERPKDERHPTRHAVRVKALHFTKGMVFTADTDGVVIAWRMEEDESALAYVCSANCKGRITAMSVVPV